METGGTLERLSDSDLMLRVQWGSEPAFAEVYRRYYRRLLDFFFGMSRDVQMAEDLCHETFLRIWRLRARYSPSGSFAAYVFTVARHVWQEQRRQVFRQPRTLTPFSDDAPGDAFTIPDGHAPDEQACRAEIGEQVFAAIEKLPEEQRMAFVLRTVNGLSLYEIAAVMQCPVNTVRSRRLLAIRRLRELLQGLFVL
ncbi:MAG TPA: sigma-70 family RNA polymerase sigma factor [Candidatus Hydrogenedentes bacterium]|nr:sigma-70 family RNA polymerase sigma factor [Candidatus Hydrogenedentota bacterium]